MTKTPFAAEAYPLYWPDGWPRVEWRKSAPYKVPPGRAISHLRRELELFRAQHQVISSNIPLRGDGLPYAGATDKYYADTGVAVYFTLRVGGEDAQQVVACDKWNTVHHNIRAIGLCIEAMRMIERTGASELLRRAFEGFKALPPAEAPPAPWWEVLQVSAESPELIIDAAYRALARAAHPDAGGSDAAMAELNRAYEEARAQL